MPHVSRLDRIRGCMLGMAVGDALGAPLEGLSAQQIRAHYGRVTDYVDGSQAWKKKQYRWRLEGLYTDDTQQALVLADVLLELERIDPDRVAELYLGLLTPRGSFSGAHRRIGRSFRYVLAALERGDAPQWVGQPSAGIGAAMRIAPVPLYFGDDAERMFNSVMAASLMTHRDIRSISGALFVSHVIRRLLSGQPRTPSLLLWAASDVARDTQRIVAEYPHYVLNTDVYGASLARAAAHAESLFELPRDRALAALAQEANRHGARPACKCPTMGFPPACIPTCLYVLLCADSLENAVTEIINLGGDTDTTGAILGAMAGACFGVDAIPRRWLDNLQNREGIDVRAMALHQRSTAGLEVPDLIATEQELTRRESEIVVAYALAASVGGSSRDNHIL
jgi:ADP-ribosyl-[dinitrogen reductase] hydrolase